MSVSRPFYLKPSNNNNHSNITLAHMYNLDDDDEIQSVFRARAYEIESCLHPDFSVSFCEPQKL